MQTCEQTPLHAHDTSDSVSADDVTILNSIDNNIRDLVTSLVRDVSSPSAPVGSPDVVQLSRPPKLTIKLNRDRKCSAFVMSPYVDPTVRNPKRPKMLEFGLPHPADQDSLRSLNEWISDSSNMRYEYAWSLYLLSTLEDETLICVQFMLVQVGHRITGG